LLNDSSKNKKAPDSLSTRGFVFCSLLLKKFLKLLTSSADYFFAGSATGAAGAVGAAAGFLSLSST